MSSSLKKYIVQIFAFSCMTLSFEHTNFKLDAKRTLDSAARPVRLMHVNCEIII